MSKMKDLDIDFSCLPSLPSPRSTPWQEVLLPLLPSGASEGGIASIASTAVASADNNSHQENCRRRQRRLKMSAFAATSPNSMKREASTPPITYSRRPKRQKELAGRLSPRLGSKAAISKHTVEKPTTNDWTNREEENTEFDISAPLFWQGQAYRPASNCKQPLPLSISDPLPVRVPRSTLSRLPNRASKSDEGDWILGLAIHSYVERGRPELLYVVLLDDGSEVHLPCGQLEHILLAPVSDNKKRNGRVQLQRGYDVPPHPSSLELEDNASDSSDDNSSFEKTFDMPDRRPLTPDSSFGFISYRNDDSHELLQLQKRKSDSDILEVPTVTTFDPHSTVASAFHSTVPCNGRTEPTDLAKDMQLNSSNFESVFHHMLNDNKPRKVRLTNLRHEARRGKSITSSMDTDFSSRQKLPSEVRGDLKLPSLVIHINDACYGAGASERDLLRSHVGAEVATAAVPPDQALRESANPKIDAAFSVLLSKRQPASTVVLSSPTTERHGRVVPESGRPLAQLRSPSRPGRRRAFLEDTENREGTDTIFSRPRGRFGSLNPRGTTSRLGSMNANDSSLGAGSGGRGRRAVRRGRRHSAAAEASALADEFCEESWTTNNASYINEPLRFTGPTPGPAFPHRRLPSKLALFSWFWHEKTLARICEETNRYASEAHPDTHLPVGGPYWWALTPPELRAFLGISLMMGIKRLPNHRAYWSKQFPFLYCNLIASTMSKLRYEDITRCLHVSDDTAVDNEEVFTHGHKLSKLSWLIAEIQRQCRAHWNLNQEVTVDESMVRYKGKYCPIRQYLPQKPTKWGIKVWSLADAKKKYVYDFDVFCGSLQRASVRAGEGRRAPRRPVERGQASSGYDVVMLLLRGLHGRGHVVITDSYFTSVKLTLDLAELGTFATGTVRSNRVGLPKALAVKRLFAEEPRGTIVWRMHVSRKISCVVWVDKRPVLLLSSFYSPLARMGEQWPTVPRWINGEEKRVVTSPVHKGFTDFMRGVDVADQMREAYSAQIRSHKWWHRLFFYLIDTTVVNCYILYKAICESVVKEPVHRIDFNILLAQALCKPWRVKRGCVSRFRLATPAVHSLVRTNLRRKCRACLSKTRTNLCCEQCGGVYLHMGDCFRQTHYPLRR